MTDPPALASRPHAFGRSTAPTSHRTLAGMLTVLSHPAAAHALTLLRDVNTPTSAYRTLGHIVATVLVVEATRDLPLRPHRVRTPLEDHTGVALPPIAAVAILRAGLGLVEAVRDLLPDVAIGCLGLERDHETAQAHEYFAKLPALRDRPVLLLDPMLATGGSAVMALDRLKREGATDIRFLSLVAAPEGIERVRATHPDVRLFTASIDRQLDARKYILPGLGDYGDRLYGT